MATELLAGIVRILTSSGATAGTGFVVTDDGLITTCYHVVLDSEGQKQSSSPPRKVNVVFRATGERREAWLESSWCSSRNDDDIAILRVDGSLPNGVKALPIGSSSGTDQHPFSSFGFSAVNPEHGSWGKGEILEETKIQNSRVLQLSSPQVARGFSGAPVLDKLRQRVVGMVRFIAYPDKEGRSTETAFITPIETLRDICPVLELSDVCPYRNLEAFTEDDKAFFFGRERDIEAILEKLQAELPFIAIFGPSGSGKSSVVRAGLIPLLREGAISGSDRWNILVTRPTDHSFKQQLADLAQESTHFALIIDQFEELFAYDESVRAEVINYLTNLLDGSRPVTLIIVMRDDFFSLFAQHEDLARSLNGGLITISSTLTSEELEDIISKPAISLGWQFEAGLVERIVNDTLETTRGNKKVAHTTALPLLEFALTQLWERHRDGVITHDAYDYIGGVSGGLKKWANEAYYTFDKRKQSIVRRIFTDLIHPGDEGLGIPDSRRPRALESLIRQDDDFEEVLKIVQQLTRNRLLVMSQDTGSRREQVEIIHDALLREWTLLREWIEEDRRYLAWQAKLEEKVQDWTKSDFQNPTRRDPHRLLGGKDLVEAEEWQFWLAVRKGSPRKEELAFINASKKHQSREVFRLRLGIGTLSVLLAIVIILGSRIGIFAIQTNNALQEANRETQLAQSRALAANANYYLLKNQLDLSLLLSIKAYRTNDNYATRDSLLNALEYSPHIRKMLYDYPNSVTGLTFTPNGRSLLTLHSDGSALLWDTVTGTHRMLYAPSVKGNKDGGILLSPNGKMLAFSDAKGLWLLDTVTGSQSKLLDNPSDNTISIYAFSQNGQMLATDDGQGGIALWNVASRTRIASPLTGGDIKGVDRFAQVYLIVFSPDDKLMAISICPNGNMTYANGGFPYFCGAAHIVLWDIAASKGIGFPLTGHLVGVKSLAFNPNDSILASGGTDHTIVLWSTKTQKPLGDPLVGHTEYVVTLAFSPDGNLLASGSNDKTVQLWNVTPGSNLALEPFLGHRFGEPLYGHQSGVSTIAFSPDGKQMVSASSDGTIIVWDISDDSPISQQLQYCGSPVFGFSPTKYLVAEAGYQGMYLCNIFTGKSIPLQTNQSLVATAISPDGRTLASYSDDGTITLWNILTNRPEPILQFKDDSFQKDEPLLIKFSPNGRILATSANAHLITLWDTATGYVVHRITSLAQINNLDFSPDGKTIATGSSNKTVMLWSVETGESISQPLTGHESAIAIVLFSPDGRTFASRSGDGTILIWDISTLKVIERLSLGGSQFPATAMAYNPDGKILAASSGIYGNQITLWDIADNEIFTHPLTSPYDIFQLMFGQDGQLLTAVDQYSGTGPLILWDVNINSWIPRACAIVNRNLTASEWNQFFSGEPYSKLCPDPA